MSYINQVLILQCGPPSLDYWTLPAKKRSFFPLQFGQEENISGNQLKGVFTDLF